MIPLATCWADRSLETSSVNLGRRPAITFEHQIVGSVARLGKCFPFFRGGLRQDT